MTPEQIKAAREALSSLDDYASMDVGVNAIGPRGVLESFIGAVEHSLSAQDEVLTELVRYYRDCCPGGAGAFMVPKSFADQCHATFKVALAVAAPSPAIAVEPTKPTLIAYVATDLDGRYDVGTTPEKAKERAGHGCDTVFPIYDIGENIIPSPSPIKPNADCSGEPTNYPDNEGYGCACDPMNEAGKDQA